MPYSVLLCVFRCQFKKEFRDFLADVWRKYDHAVFYFCNACDGLLTTPNVLCENAACRIYNITPKRIKRSRRTSVHLVNVKQQLELVLARTINVLVGLREKIHTSEEQRVPPRQVTSKVETSDFDMYWDDIETAEEFRGHQLTVVLTVGFDGVRFSKLTRLQTECSEMEREGLEIADRHGTTWKVTPVVKNAIIDLAVIFLLLSKCIGGRGGIHGALNSGAESLEKALDGFQNYTHATKFVLSFEDWSQMTGSEKDAFTFVVFPLIAATGLCDHIVGCVVIMCYWCIARVMSKGGSFTVRDIELLKSLAASMKSVWEKISRSLFTLKLHVLLYHCLIEDIDYVGPLGTGVPAALRDCTVGINVDQNVTNCEEILVKKNSASGFLLKKELTGLLEIEAERNGDESFVRLRKVISEGACSSRFPPLLHLSRRWRGPRHSHLDWASLFLIHDVEIGAALRDCKLRRVAAHFYSLRRLRGGRRGTLTPAHKWLQFRKTAGNGFESPPAEQNSMTSLTSETSYSPRQLVPLDTYNYHDTIETDSAVDMGSHVADSQQSTSLARRHVNDSQSNARRHVNYSQSTLHSGRHMNLRSGSKTILNVTTTTVSDVVTRTVSNAVNGRTPADVAEEIFARRTVKASRVTKAAWEFVEGPQFEEVITKKLPTARVDLRELRDFQLKVSRLPSSSDVVVCSMQKLLREQSELMAGLDRMD
ncbi:unnamed protein product [Heligmosomoides polygyrus]|uniref:Reverse transcriptase domain-containing protein n=1 Tax=Heligmosomoides polygyrus TaxID=6339 RepID=A0A183GKB5_HELPZ|nr:unnamed protein product [Heligmosomoides polygyrus]